MDDADDDGDDAPDDATGDDTACMAGLSVTGCERCPGLVESRSRIVDGVGPAEADLLFVGEAPGETEDAEGEPFVGRSGDVLDEELRAVGLDRADVRITNCVRCRPPENRDPRAPELANCRPYLERETAVVDPELVVAIGKVPAQHLLGRGVAVTSEAGDVFDCDIGGRRRQVLVSVHPAATLYDPSQQETLRSALETAADYAGDGGQTTLGGF